MIKKGKIVVERRENAVAIAELIELDPGNSMLKTKRSKRVKGDVLLLQYIDDTVFAVLNSKTNTIYSKPHIDIERIRVFDLMFNGTQVMLNRSGHLKGFGPACNIAYISGGSFHPNFCCDVKFNNNSSRVGTVGIKVVTDPLFWRKYEK